MLFLQFDGEQEVVSALTDFENLDVEALLDQAAALLLERMRARFLAQVDPDGVAWVPSLASRLRAKTGRGGGTLFDSGMLFHSIQLYSGTPGERAIGTDVPYAPFHQYGTKDLIMRRFLGFSDEDVQLIQQLVAQRVQDALGETNG